MKKSTLNQVQKIFWKNLLSTDSDKRSLSKILERSALGRMFIYQEAYYLRILGALREDFAQLSHVLGEKDFSKLAKEYLDAHPSEHYSLRFIGQRFPAFIKRSHWNKKFPWAAELAEFEWIKVDLFDGIDHPTLTKENLATVSRDNWPQIKLKFVPSLTVLKTRYRIEDVESWPKDNKKVSQIALKPGWLKIWRKDEEIYYSLMTTTERIMLELAQSGKKFSELCEEMIGVKKTDTGRPNTIETIVNLLSKWLDEQILESLSLN